MKRKVTLFLLGLSVLFSIWTMPHPAAAGFRCEGLDSLGTTFIFHNYWPINPNTVKYRLYYSTSIADRDASSYGNLVGDCKFLEFSASGSDAFSLSLDILRNVTYYHRLEAWDDTQLVEDVNRSSFIADMPLGNGYINGISKLTLTGIWQDGIDNWTYLEAYGKNSVHTSDTSKFELNFGNGLVLAPAAGWMSFFGGGAGEIGVHGDSTLIVTGNPGSHINISNGNILFAGGNTPWTGTSSTISGSSSVILSGDMPSSSITPDSDDENGIEFYGGSRSYGGNDTIYGNAGVEVNGSWHLQAIGSDIYVGYIYGGSSSGGDGITAVKGKTYVTVDNNDACISSVYGGGPAWQNSRNTIEGGTEVTIKRGSFNVVGGGSRSSNTGYASVLGNTVVTLNNANAPDGSMIFGGGRAGSASDVGATDGREPYSVVSGDTSVTIEPDITYTQGKGLNDIYGGGYSRGPGRSEVLGSAHVVVKGDSALNLIKPQDEGGWTYISAGGYRRDNTTVSNDVKGDGNITFRDITDLNVMGPNTTINGQGRMKTGSENSKLYNNSVAGKSRLIFDNVTGKLNAVTLNFDEIIIKGNSNIVADRSLAQLPVVNNPAETCRLIVEQGSRIRITKDTALGTLDLSGTIEIDEGVTLRLNSGITKAAGAQITGLGNILIASYSDFNFDGKPDILWQEHSTDRLCVWYMDGVKRISTAYLQPGNTSGSWKIVAAQDMNADGKTDILWQEYSTNRLCVWYMDGVKRISSAYLQPGNASGSWKIVAVQDMNADGKPDILWQELDKKQLCVWYMDGLKRTSTAFLQPGTITGDWRVAALKDLNGDGNPDILWQEHSTNRLCVWYMDGVKRTSSAYLQPGTTSGSWKIVAVQDMNADGNPDILWQELDKKELCVWYMDGLKRTSTSYLQPGTVTAGWLVAGSAGALANNEATDGAAPMSASVKSSTNRALVASSELPEGEIGANYIQQDNMATKDPVAGNDVIFVNDGKDPVGGYESEKTAPPEGDVNAGGCNSGAAGLSLLIMLVPLFLKREN